MQTNCSSVLVEQPTLVLPLSAPAQPLARREAREISSAGVARTPVPPADIAPLWFAAKNSLTACERLEGAAWLALALGSAAVVLWSLGSAFAP